MLRIALVSAVWSLVLVNAHPLMQSIQPCPALNYQQNVYRPPYSEALILQPSNNNPYAQQVLIQPPPSPYQSLQIPSLLEQISQMYWEKLLSNLSLRDLLDPNKILQNQYGKDIQTNLHPNNAGGVVNNYIIIPPNYLKQNGTVSRSPKAKRGGYEISNPVKESVNLTQKKKKFPDNNSLTTPNTSNIKKSPKAKQNLEKSWNFSTDNIKCFTPADVLEDETYQPNNKKSKNHEDSKQCRKERGNRNKKSKTLSETNEKSQKNRKTKNSKAKKKSRENKVNDSKEKTVDNISLLTTTDKKIRQRKKELEKCKCVRKDEVADCGTKIAKNVPQSSKQDVDDFLLSNLLQQDCTDLENRRTRNSKTVAAKKDFRNVYPDFSDDISKSLTWYMNDVFSPHSLQLAPNNFLLGNNMYPFDLSQIYQIPQYSHADINKSNGNTGKNQNTKRRKKKKKKSSKPKTVIENSSNNDDSNYLQISETNIQIPETIEEIPEANGQSQDTSTIILATISEIPETNTQAPEIKTQISEKNILIKPSTTIEDTSIINEIMAVETTTDKVLECFGEPNKSIENIKIVQEKFDTLKEIYETQIPESVEVRKSNNNDTDIPEKAEKDMKEIPFDFHTFNLVPEFQSEDDIFNIFMKDYYPDFRADNHAYLVNEEEIDIRNIHDRYFYTTDKNIDSREIYSTEQINQLSNTEVIYTEDELRNENEHNNNKYSPQEEDKSQEVVFRTPPGLEAPDFITRKINRDRLDSTEIYYQHNTYDDDFDRFNLDSVADKTDHFMTTAGRHSTNENKSGSLVETVYARSKVVKYGQGQDLNKPFRPKVENIFPTVEDTSIQNDGDKTVVIAKSLGPEDFW